MIDPVSRHVLDNGLTVLCQSVRRAPVATFWLWYRVGSRNERTGLTGASHWVEHMLFKGTPRYPRGALDRLIAREGGYLNAMTWLDWTSFYTTLPAERLEMAMDIEADRMVAAAFDPDEVESERDVVIAEREGSENSPAFLLLEEVQSAAIRAHPYHHDVIGWKSDLAAITRDELVDHYRRHYHPANAIAVAVGDLDEGRALDIVRRHFDGLPPGRPVDAVTTVEPPQRGERRVTVRGDERTSLVVVAHHAPAATDPDFFAFQVLDAVLGGAKSMNVFGGNPPNRTSMLYRSLVDGELASEVSSGLAATIDPYLHTISATVREGVSPDRVESAIVDTVERVRTDGLCQAALSRAVKQARAQFAYSAESVTDQGFWIGFAEAIATQDWRTDYLERLAAVTTDDVLGVAGRWLDSRGRTIGVYVPDPTGDAA